MGLIKNNPTLNIVPDNVLATNMWQGIIWSNDGFAYWPVYVSVGLDGIIWIYSSVQNISFSTKN